MDRRRRQMLSMALAPGGVLLCRAPARAATTPQQVTVALTARNSLYHLPLMLADRLGYFRQQSLQVNLVSHESGPAAMTSVLQGKADVLAGAFERVFDLQRQGHFFQAFVQMSNTPMSVWVFRPCAVHRAPGKTSSRHALASRRWSQAPTG